MTSLQKLIFPGPFEVELQLSGVSPLDDEQFRVQTQFNLISPGTELAFYTGTHHGLPNPDNTWAKYPFSPGYASAGIVIEAGIRSGVEVGQTVFTPSPHASHFQLKGRNGVDFYVLPPSVAPEIAVFARLAAIAMTALAVAPIEADAKVVVLGLGLVGNFAAQLYQLAGAHVVGVDTEINRLEIARRCGLENAVLGGEELPARLHEIFGAEPDVVIEATGVPALTNAALALVRRRGRVVLLGSPRGALEIDIYTHIHARGTQLLGAHESLQGFDGLPERAALTLQVLESIARGELRVRPLLTHRWPVNDVRGAYELLLHHKDTALGVVFEW